ncbi:MAG: hypothetical protein M3Q19_07515 [Pseudomonadota bacterium]|nr:hypothetical protein [Pseudomonadota bacterium]
MPCGLGRASPNRRIDIPPSSNQTTFYRAQADAARARSDEATLQNVKDNQLRAAAAWDVLADRSDKADRMRAAEALKKAQQQLIQG